MSTPAPPSTAPAPAAAPAVVPEPLAGVQLLTGTGDGDALRLVAGLRLAMYVDDDHTHPAIADVPGFGPAALVGARDGADRPPGALRAAAPHASFELELAGVTPATAAHAHEVLEELVAPDVAAELVALALEAPKPWSFDGVTRLGGALAALGAETFDVCIATFGERTYCTQHGHLVVTPNWLVTLWQPPRAYDGAPREGAFPLPGSRVRHHFTRTEVTGWTGPARLARAVQDVMRHNEYQAERASALIEDWEHRFFALFAADADEADREEGLLALREEMAEIRAFVSATHHANKTLWRRTQNQPAMPRAVRAELIERCRELEELLAARRSELRDCFALMAGADAEQQAAAARRTEGGVRTLTMLATYATGLVLVPGLVVALYGAQVRGLPGQGHVAGLAYLALACALTALVTIAAFARAAQLRPTRPRRG